MNIKKKYISWNTGFIRFKNDIEINWNLRDWALPLSIHVETVGVFIDVFCVSFIVKLRMPRKR